MAFGVALGFKDGVDKASEFFAGYVIAAMIEFFSLMILAEKENTKTNFAFPSSFSDAIYFLNLLHCVKMLQPVYEDVKTDLQHKDWKFFSKL